MSAVPQRSRQQPLRETILMGIQRIAVTPQLAEFTTPGVYVQEIPSGATD